MSEIIKGADLRILVNNGTTDETVYHETSCDLEFSTSFDEVVTKDTNGGQEVTPKDLTWSASGESLMVDNAPAGSMDFTDLFAAWSTKQKLPIKIKLEGTQYSGFTISGFAYVESLAPSAPADGQATMSFSLKCTGVPTLV